VHIKDCAQHTSSILEADKGYITKNHTAITKWNIAQASNYNIYIYILIKQIFISNMFMIVPGTGSNRTSPWEADDFKELLKNIIY
jgi:hypothetical protein